MTQTMPFKMFAKYTPFTPMEGTSSAEKPATHTTPSRTARMFISVCRLMDWK